VGGHGEGSIPGRGDMRTASGVDILGPGDYLAAPRPSRTRVVRTVVWLVVALVVAQITACHHGSKDTLTDRAKGYWELKQQKRWEEAYDGYLDPAIKASLTKDAFLKKRQLALDILAFTVTDLTQNGDQATVHVKVDANIPLRLPGQEKVQIRKDTIDSEESWVRRDGVWYVHVSE